MAWRENVYEGDSETEYDDKASEIKRNNCGDRYSRGYGRSICNANVANRGELRIVLDLTKDEVPQTDQELSKLVKDATLGVKATVETVQVHKDEYDKLNEFYAVGAMLLNDFMVFYEENDMGPL